MSHLESPLLDFARSFTSQNLLVISNLTVSIEGRNQSVETTIRDFSTNVAVIAASQPSKQSNRCSISSSSFRTSYSCTYHRGSKIENSLHLLKGLELTTVSVKPYHPGYSSALQRGHLSRVSESPTSLSSTTFSTSLFPALLKCFVTPAPPTTLCCWASASISPLCWFTAVDEEEHCCLLYYCRPAEAMLTGSSRSTATCNCPSRSTTVSRFTQERFPLVQKPLLPSSAFTVSLSQQQASRIPICGCTCACWTAAGSSLPPLTPSPESTRCSLHYFVLLAASPFYAATQICNSTAINRFSLPFLEAFNFSR
ncbi:hypothetical protein B296_00033733 [Ensete ventricosum]|uniref:Uncharacterized protein n=1 Tax=Ensete ventricosum TaxID=4639 RepID=A0A426YD23_ENSVE|nr:hypothetical protein B296_00033733 [Ensete ventricosum]